MKAPSVKPVRCAIYTRVSTDNGLDQEFNSLDAQYDAASAYIKSQAHAGWNEMRDAGCDVSEGNDTEAGKGNQQQRRFARTPGAVYNRCATRTPRIFVTDQI